MTTLTMPWEDVELLTDEQAAAELAADGEYDAWLDELWGDLAVNDPLFARWLDAGAPMPANEGRPYVPFQLPASEYADCYGNVTAEPGYYESLYPFAL